MGSDRERGAPLDGGDGFNPRSRMGSDMDSVEVA